MLSRKQGYPSPSEAKAKLKDLGWTYRAAAPVLGVHFTHLCLVLNGHRVSRRLLTKIAQLPRKLHAH